MIKIFISLIIFFNFVFGSDLLIHSKVFTHILNYDRNLDKKIIDKEIKFIIIYNNALENDAKNLKNFILKKYKSIKNHPLNIVLIKENNVKKDLKDATAIYLFNLSDEILDFVINFAIKNHIITFANKLEMLKRGVSIALSADRRVKPIINKKIIKKSDIQLNSTLLKVSKIYE